MGIEVPRFDHQETRPDKYLLLGKLLRGVDNPEYPIDDDRKYGRFLDDLVLSTVEAFPELDRSPLEVDIKSMDLLQAYTEKFKSARVLINSTPRYRRDENADAGSSMVVLFLRVENTFPSGLIFNASADHGVSVDSFGNKLKNERLEDFIKEFRDKEDILSKIVGELTYKAAIESGIEEVRSGLGLE